MKLSRFKRLQIKLERKGYTKEEAGNIAYSIGRNKYGKKGMAKKAALGRKRAEERRKKEA